MTKKIKVAVFGCGYWGKNLIRNFSQLGSLGAIVDPNKDLADIYSSKYGAQSMSTEQALNSDLDAIVIAAPAELHAKLAIQALDAGKHVYVEKPIALNEKDALAMILASKKADKKLMVGHLLQYHPIFVALRKKVRGGELGELHYAYSHRLSLGKFRVEEDAFLSLAPHDVSMILSLFDESPIHVSKRGSAFVTRSVDDEARLDMVFPSGGRAHIFTSWLHPFKEQRLVVVGKKGMAVFDDQKPWEEKLAIYRHGIDTNGDVPVPKKADVDYIKVRKGEPLENECRHFIDSIINDTTPFTDGKEALRVLRVMEAGAK